MPPILRFLLPRSLFYSTIDRIDIYTRNPTTTIPSMLCYASTNSKKFKKRAPETIIKTTSPIPQSGKYFSLAEALGNSNHPSIHLYGCSNRKFVVSCYGLAGAMLGWSGYTFHTNIEDARPGLPRWVKRVTWGSIAVMVVMSVAICYYPTRLIQAIYAHPIPATASRPASISLTLHRRPFLPTLPVKKIHVAFPDQVTLGEPFYPINKPTLPEVAGEDTSTGLLKKVWGKVNPANVVSSAMKGISTSGFVMLKVEGVGSYRIQREGWVWEKRGLDRIFKVKNVGQL